MDTPDSSITNALDFILGANVQLPRPTREYFVKRMKDSIFTMLAPLKNQVILPTLSTIYRGFNVSAIKEYDLKIRGIELARVELSGKRYSYFFTDHYQLMKVEVESLADVVVSVELGKGSFLNNGSLDFDRDIGEMYDFMLLETFIHGNMPDKRINEILMTIRASLTVMKAERERAVAHLQKPIDQLDDMIERAHRFDFID